MANGLFNNYKNLLGGAGTHTLPDFTTDDIRFCFIDTADHDPDTANDVDLADITAGAIVATSDALTCTFGSVAAGVFDHADTTVSVTGDSVEEILYYGFESGVAATSPLICVFDTFAAGMPFTPSGGNVDVQPSGSGVFGF